MTQSPETVRWGIAGTGSISRTMAAQVRNSKTARIVAVSSRSETSAQAFAAEHDVAKGYGSFEALLADDAVEAVYIGLPHAAHKAAILAALTAGKHVLCEKPLALNAAEVEEITAHPRAADLLVSEGFMVRHQPQWLWVEETIRSGAIGEVVSVTAFSALTVPRSPPDPTRGALAGDGSLLLDVGCYSVHLVRTIFGSEPQRISAHVGYDDATGRDVFVNAHFQFANGHADITVADGIRRGRRIHILGTEGNIEIMTPIHAPPGGGMRVLAALKDDGNGDPKEFTFEAVDQYGLEMEDFSAAIRKGRQPRVTLGSALGNARALDAIVCSAHQDNAWVVL